MDAGGDDPRAFREPVRDPQAAFVLREIDLVQGNVPVRGSTTQQNSDYPW